MEEPHHDILRDRAMDILFCLDTVLLPLVLKLARVGSGHMQVYIVRREKDREDGRGTYGKAALKTGDQ